jgi:hypothetical protein
MNEYAEKRNFHRMGVDSPAKFRIQGKEEIIDGIVKNLSATGLLIHVAQEIGPGTQLLAHIVPANTITPPLSAIATVLRSQPAETGGYELACAIKQILEEEEAGSSFP